MATVDTVQAYWDRRPCNIRHSTKPAGTKEYFDEVEARKYFVEPHIPGFAEFDRWKGKLVLEVGCGIGTDSINFARAGAKLTVTDLSAESLAMTRKRFEVFGLDANFYQANAEQLSATVPVEEYDLIYSFGVLHHTPNPEAAFAEILKYCGPHTELRVMLYSKWCWKVLWIIAKFGHGAFWKADELVARYSEAEVGCPVTYYYTFAGVKRLLQGLAVERIWKDHIFPYRIEDYVQYRYVRVWYFRWMPRAVFRWLERHLGWHTMVVARRRPVGGRWVAGEKS